MRSSPRRTPAGNHVLREWADGRVGARQGASGGRSGGSVRRFAALARAYLSRLCRIQLGRLLAEPRGDGQAESFSLALALRFVETHAHEGWVARPPSPALAVEPRFTEFLTRLLGPLCPDPGCVHREGCDIHRPFAAEILERHFDLPAFRPDARIPGRIMALFER